MTEIKLRISYYLCFISLFVFCQSGLSQSTPPSLGNMVLWLKADSGIVKFGTTDSVQQWQDGAGTNDAAAQATAANMPRLINGGALMNNKPVLAFDGVNDILTGPTLAGLGAGQYSIFILSNGNNQTGNASYGLFGVAAGEGVFDIYRRSGGNQNVTVITSGSIATAAGSFATTGYPYRVISLTQNTGSGGARLRVNGGTPVTGTLAAFADNIYTVGRANGTLNGNIAEILVYNTSLPDSLRTQVESYLYNKYAPPVSFDNDTINLTSFCPYTLSAGNRYTTYQWNTGGTDSTISVSQSGTYSVTVTNVFGRVSSDTVVVNIPSAKVSTLSNVICAGNSVRLSTQYSSPQYSLDWNNGLSTNDTIVVNTSGNYFVKVTDVNSSCSIYSDTVSISVDNFGSTVYLGPDTTLCAGNTIKLVSPTNTQQLIYSWSPGATTDSMLTVNATGTYSVTVTNANGCTGTDAIYVTIAGNAPVASFAGDSLCLGEVYVPGNSSYSTDAATIVSNTWAFGNGDNNTLALPSYVYAQPGNYVVSLTVATSSGCTATTSHNVLVHSLPAAAINNNTLGCTQVPSQFTSTSTPAAGTTIVLWNWAFGDGGLASVQAPQHIYSGTGTFSPQLIVTDNNGCSDTAISSITITNNAPLPIGITHVQPSNAVVVTNSTIAFEWGSGSNAVAYRLILANDNAFTSYTSYYVGGNTNYTLTLAPSMIYYWKVRAYNVCNDSVDFGIRTFTIFSPSNVGAMRLWLSADTGIVKLGVTDSVQYWNDYAGSNDTARQTTAASMPRLISGGPLVNNKPVLSFDGSNDVMTGHALTGLGAGAYTIFLLANGNSQTGNSSYGLFGVATGEGVFDIYRRCGTSQNITVLTSNSLATATGSFSTTGFPYRLISLTQATGTGGAKFRVNDTLAVTATLNTFADDIYTLGRANGTLNGNIAEVMVYPTALSDSVRKLVESYIYDKYAPPVNLGPDIVSTYSLCPVTVSAGPRFTKYLWSTGDTTQQIIVTATSRVWVRVTDVFGRQSSDTLDVITPYKGMNTTDTILCSGNSAILQPILVNSPYTFSWNSGQSTQAISVTEPGSYVVTVTDTSAAQCFLVTDTVFVVVDSFSNISLLPTDTISCTGNTLQLDDNGYAIATINWSTADTTALITIGGAGIYTVTATDINQCTVSDAINVTIKGVAPTVNFGVDNVCYGFTSSFSDSSSTPLPDVLSQWQWDFGDGDASAVQNPNHDYNAAGTYPVTLTVSTDSGCSASITKYAEVYAPPSANFTQLAPVCAGSAANFSDLSVAPIGTNIAGWQWIVSGNTISVQQNAAVTFPQQGVNSLTLIVSTSQGCNDTMTRNVEVFPPLLADFEVADVCVGDSSYFFDVTPSFSVISRTWVYGDGSPNGSIKNPAHKYTAPGNYNVLLTVRNAIGCQDTVLKTVTAASKPVAKFGNLTGCEDAFYIPLDSSTSAQEPINSWQWTIGGFTYSAQAPQRYFANPGTYPVKLIVATETGCSDSVTRNIVISPRPTANFTFNPLYGEAPVDVTFTNQSTDAATYEWQFGDGDNSTLQNPIHTYTQNGTYNVVLKAISQFGCSSSRTKPYTVVPTDLDLSVDEASVIVTPLPDGSSLAQVVVQGSNLNTRIINHVQFYVSMGGVGVLAEDWNGTLYTGQILVDTFSAQFVVPAGKGDSYICVSAMSVNNGQTETRTDNNSQCFSIDGGIQLMGPLPNPALNQSVLGIVLPKHGKVTIDIADMMGKYLVQGEELELPEGRSDYDLPVGQMTAGEYFIRISYNDEKVVRKLVIRR